MWLESCFSIAKSCWLHETPWPVAHQASLSLTISQVCPSSCPLNWWCHPTISSSAALFSFCLQSFPASGSFPTSWLFTSCGPTIGVLASASVLPMSIQSWFPLGLTGLISLLSKGLSKSLLQHHNLKASIKRCLLLGRKAMTKLHSILKKTETSLYQQRPV